MMSEEIKLRQAEYQFLKNLEQGSGEISFEAFIPDHLEFNCQTGRLLYRISTGSLESFWILPKP